MLLPLGDIAMTGTYASNMPNITAFPLCLPSSTTVVSLNSSCDFATGVCFGAPYRSHINCVSGWWFQPLWKILVNGKDYPNAFWEKKMFETTNQVYIIMFSHYTVPWTTLVHCLACFAFGPWYTCAGWGVQRWSSHKKMRSQGLRKTINHKQCYFKGCEGLMNQTWIWVTLALINLTAGYCRYLSSLTRPLVQGCFSCCEIWRLKTHNLLVTAEPGQPDAAPAQHAAIGCWPPAPRPGVHLGHLQHHK